LERERRIREGEGPGIVRKTFGQRHTAE